MAFRAEPFSIFPPSNAVSPFKLNLSFDASTSAAPPAFFKACNALAAYVERLIWAPATVWIGVGWGEVDGTSLGGSAVGESNYFLDPYTYAEVKTIYATPFGGDMAQAALQLPATDPTSGGTIWLTEPQEACLGLTGGGSASLPDAFVGFSSTFTFDFGGGPSIAGSTFDFCGTFIHEITECFGRFLLAGTRLGGTKDFSILDLFRYSSAGTPNLGLGTTAGYFSLDSGATNIKSFNTSGVDNTGVTGNDPGDWAGGGGIVDACDALATQGVLSPFSSIDMRLMGAIACQTKGIVPWVTTGI